MAWVSPGGERRCPQEGPSPSRSPDGPQSARWGPLPRPPLEASILLRWDHGKPFPVYFSTIRDERVQGSFAVSHLGLEPLRTGGTASGRAGRSPAPLSRVEAGVPEWTSSSSSWLIRDGSSRPTPASWCGDPRGQGHRGQGHSRAGAALLVLWGSPGQRQPGPRAPLDLHPGCTRCLVAATQDERVGPAPPLGSRCGGRAAGPWQSRAQAHCHAQGTGARVVLGRTPRRQCPLWAERNQSGRAWLP